MDHVFVFPHVVRLCPDLNTCLFFHPDKMRELNMRLREFTDGTWARKAQIKVPTHTKTFFSFCRRMKWSIPQSTDLGHSIPSPFMATLRILQLVPCKKRLRCFVLMWCPTICCNTTKKHQGLPSWSHGRVAHHGNQGLPQPRVHVHDGVLLTNLPVERQKLPEKVLHKKQCLEVEKKGVKLQQTCSDLLAWKKKGSQNEWNHA